MKTPGPCLFQVEPEKYPSDALRTVRAATRDTLGNEIQFTSLRTFVQGPDGSIEDPEREIEFWTESMGLGKVLWPVYPTLFAPNLEEMVACAARKGLFLFDFWGYVPGATPARHVIWGEYAIPEAVDACLRDRMGGRFLGYDNGEQDGRYVGSFASRLQLAESGRVAQHERFHRHFTALWDAMRHHTVVLSSLMFLHYFAREGNATMLGAETGQALPCASLWFSFIRGAARQYGYLYYGNASIWNRWGYKNYTSEGTGEGYAWGPRQGTSLSLLRRLLYTEYVYGCDLLGFEQGLTVGFDTEASITGKSRTLEEMIATSSLSPIGRIQRQAIEVVAREGRPGAYSAPLAVLMDFHCGWNPPRHLYVPHVYKVWGNLPYEEADFQAHALFSLLYPGYEDAGFFHDERGFLAATPYGDILDVLYSDVAPEILCNYEACVVLSSLPGTLENLDLLDRFLAEGGHALLFDGALAQALLLRHGLADRGAGTWDTAGGRITLLAEGDGLAATGQPFSPDNRVDAPIAMPLDLAEEVKARLDAVLSDLALVRIDDRALQLSVSVRKGGGELVCLVANNTAETHWFRFRDAACRMTACREVDIRDGVAGEPGYHPDALLPSVPETTPDGCPDPGCFAIAAGDVRLFVLGVLGMEGRVRSPRYPEPREEGLLLRLPASARSIQSYLLAHPTFQRHFSGFLADAGYFEAISPEEAAREAAYLRRQGIRIVVDAVRLCNHYPDYSLSGSVETRRLSTLDRLDRLFRMAAVYGCGDVVLALTQKAECNQAEREWLDSLEDSLQWLSGRAQAQGVRIHLLHSARLVSDEGRWDRWPTVASTSTGDGAGAKRVAGLWLSAPSADRFGQAYPVQAPIVGSGMEARVLSDWSAHAGAEPAFIALAAEYGDWDQVYADLQWYRERKKRRPIRMSGLLP